jgi:hypothetical protein
MLVASRRVALLDRYRVPYRVGLESPQGILRLTRSGQAEPELLFLAGSEAPAGGASFGGGRVFARCARETEVRALADERGGTWHLHQPIVGDGGATIARTLRRDDGSTIVPFDLDEVCDVLLEERYVPPEPLALRAARQGYYRLRGLLPYHLQMQLRGRYRSVQERTQFPAWPTELSLHALEASLLALVEELLGEPLPWIGHWPRPYRWAFVLTHDVERAGGYGRVEALRVAERRLGLRSAWFLVPERDYQVDESTLAAIRADGGEVALHGLRHDGRDLSRRHFPRRLGVMRAQAAAWNARGFRAPSTQRYRELITQLGVDYDSSWPDVATYEPQAGGCCSWLPFFIGDVVELPITLPQDHTLFRLLHDRSSREWEAKTDLLRRSGGMALLLTHPDYLDAELQGLYLRFAAAQAADETAWQALPHEVSSWWRDRAASSLELRSRGWSVVGPAAGAAQVRLGAPQHPGAGEQTDVDVEVAAQAPPSFAA